MSELRLPWSADEPSPATIMGRRLSEMSTRLVAEWSVGNRSCSRGSAASSLSDQALRTHLPAIIGSIGQYVRDPAYEVRREMLTQLRANGDMWHQLDYRARDLLVWLDGLSRLIMQRMQQELIHPERGDDDRLAMAAFARLAEGLGVMTSSILGVYLDRESDRHQESARQRTDWDLMFAHELRSPLHTISLSASILEAPGLSTDEDTRRRQLKIIRSALAHAESLLRHTDEVKGAENAHSLRFTTALQSLVESITEEQSGRAMASGVELSLVGAAPPLAVETVVAHLVLSNLVTNAIKYADHTKEKRWVTVRVEVVEGDEPGFVTLEVADNGIGIPESLQQYVFQRCFRAHPHVADGVGLGLAIVQDVLADRGGSIDLISQEKVGTAVRFRLPTSPIAEGGGGR